MPLNPTKQTPDPVATPGPGLGLLAQAGDPSSWPVGVPAVAGESGRQHEQLRTELKQQEDLVSLLRQRQAEAETAQILLPWLLLLLLASLAFSVWLVFRLRKLQRSVRVQRRSAPSTGPGSSVPLPLPTDQRVSLSGQGRGPDVAALAAATDLRPVASGRSANAAMGSAGQGPAERAAVTGPLKRQGEVNDGGRRAGAPGGGPDTTLAGAMLLREHDSSRTLASGSPLVGELTQSQPVRPVSVEELLDLEQQVDFFLVLGQEEAAVDLLASHIRDTGGTSALPFLKLMEVYRKQGNSEGYERIRQRFNQRFNAHAPDWAAEFDVGLGLEQYGEVMARLQQMWPRPLDALAELETLLHRRSASVMFDLPAYRELVLLHALSRDLNEQAPVSTIKVDVLLPLGDDGAETTSPRPHMTGSRSEAHALLQEWASGAEPQASRTSAMPRAAAMLDLDLTEYAAAPREFTRPAAFTEPDLQRDDWRSDMAALDEARPPTSKV